MNTILFGYRGSGKTTVGQILAQQLNQPFVDTDALVVEHFHGATIAQIWQNHGEQAFREAETLVTQRVLTDDNQVIALGGGTLTQHLARRAVQGANDDTRVYLRGSAETLLAHITSDENTSDNRPNLTAHSTQLAEIQSVLSARSHDYDFTADLIIDIENKSPQQIADEITQGL